VKADVIAATFLVLGAITGMVYVSRTEAPPTRPQPSPGSSSESAESNTIQTSISPTATGQPPDLTASADLTLGPHLELRQGSLASEARLTAVVENRNLTDEAKARHLLASLVSIPDEALISTTEAALQRLPDKAYGAALPHLLNPQTHGQVLSVLFSDLLERPDP
jgi:hypothetical protein